MATTKKKETTIDDLALEMREGFKRSDERTDKTIGDLAIMIAEGFNSTQKEIGGLKIRMDKMETKMSNLEIGQDDIRNKLDNVAYRFELVELDKRVRVLERKVK